jgi:dihydroorotate dehydrogenase
MNIFISAPFGNYIKKKNESIAVTGTWTLEPRGNRLLAVLKTLRYNRKLGGWTNRLGLPNPGLDVGLSKTLPAEVLSIAATTNTDFKVLNSIIPESKNIEINLSCPNIHGLKISELEWSGAGIFLNDWRRWCIAKVSPLTTMKELTYLIDTLGFKQIHCSNTLPVPLVGGLSGNELIPYTKILIKMIRSTWKDNIEIIAGGGIQNIGTVTEYINEGANHVSIGSLCFNPFKLNKLLKTIT